MKRTDVDSSMLASVGYDKKTKTLEAEFNSGTVCQYFDVEKEIFDELMNADSHGRYFLNNIRDVYEYEQVR